MSPTLRRPPLPPELRRTLLDRVDRRLAVIIGASVAVHLGIAVWAWLGDIERPAPVEEQAATYEPPSYEVTDVVAEAEVPGKGTPGVAAPVKPAVQTPGSPRKIDPTRLEPVDASAWANVITGNTPGMTGQDELANRLPDTELERQISHIRDTDLTVGRRPITRVAERLGTGGAPTIRDPGLERVTKGDEAVPPPRLVPLPMPRPTYQQGDNQVLNRIAGAYMAGLRRCYVKEGLSRDPSLSAKVVIAFTVDETGATTEPVAHGATAEVDGCIQRQMTSWKFAVLKDKDGDPTEASFKMSLVFQPAP